MSANTFCAYCGNDTLAAHASSCTRPRREANDWCAFRAVVGHAAADSQETQEVRRYAQGPFWRPALMTPPVLTEARVAELRAMAELQCDPSHTKQDEHDFWAACDAVTILNLLDELSRSSGDATNG